VPVGESYLGAAYLVGVAKGGHQLSDFTGFFFVDPLISPDPLMGEGEKRVNCHFPPL
jgi:hypothetical protein